MEKKDFPVVVKEEREIKRITFAKFFEDLFSAFNVERGLVYTVKMLFWKPGKLVNLYLYDGRYRVFNSFRLLFLSTAISLFVFYLTSSTSFFDGFQEGLMEGAEQDMKLQTGSFQDIFFDWYNLLLWIAIPIYGFFAYLFNRKSGYNYAEHMVAQSFFLSGSNIIYLLTLLVLVFPSTTLLVIVTLSALLYYFWIIPQWLGGKGVWFYLKNAIAYALAIFVWMIVVSVVIFIIMLSMEVPA